jgi:hypothetical protein
MPTTRALRNAATRRWKCKPTTNMLSYTPRAERKMTSVSWIERIVELTVRDAGMRPGHPFRIERDKSHPAVLVLVLGHGASGQLGTMRGWCMDGWTTGWSRGSN